MNSQATCLEPLAPERAQQLLALMDRVRGDTSLALALNGDGEVVDIVRADDPQEEHLLRDLDVHA